ncbi:hypothetical protein Cadr_000002839 [Camelus dromedarius]|uniref:Uncharacterized protein n=1 Tax=Camelus dromedarius TaxID=9838 RepID=A0A5N4C1H2_CAMDR|nr:hypothetical protein Cadr_000002839 [Camelus dromedarius]
MTILRPKERETNTNWKDLKANQKKIGTIQRDLEANQRDIVAEQRDLITNQRDFMVNQREIVAKTFATKKKSEYLRKKMQQRNYPRNMIRRSLLTSTYIDDY